MQKIIFYFRYYNLRLKHFFGCNITRMQFMLKRVIDFIRHRNIGMRQGFYCTICKRHY